MWKVWKYLQRKDLVIWQKIHMMQIRGHWIWRNKEALVAGLVEAAALCNLGNPLTHIYSMIFMF